MMKRPRFSWIELSAELKRRRVYPVIGAYAVVGWIVLQIGEVTFDPLNLPGWVMTTLIVVVIAGFPLVLVLAWVFDFTSAGIRRDKRPFLRSIRVNEKPSVAVLPLMDLSPQRDQGYFCEGVAEAVLNALTHIPNLKVAARSSSFQFAGHSGDVRKIGSELGVKALLQGSVRKPNEHLRISIQLVNTADGYDLWSETFDARSAEILDIQDQVAKAVAAACVSTIRSMWPVTGRLSKNVKACDYYLRGRQFLRRFSRKNLESARQMFHQAIDVDEEFALAWCGYADCHALLFMYESAKPDYCQKADKSSRRAAQLDSSIAEAHASRGLALLIQAEYGAAEAEFKKSLALNPQLFEAYYYYARTRFHQGDLKLAAKLFEQAAKTDPTDYKSRCLRAQILRGSSKAGESARDAVDVVKKNLEWNPDDESAFYFGAGSLITLGEVDRATRWLQQALRLNPNDPVVLYNVACGFARLGDLEAAFDYLDQANENGVVRSAWMRNDSDLDNLKDDARFVEMLDRLESAEKAVEQLTRVPEGVN